jgi:hypothetical protein
MVRSPIVLAAGCRTVVLRSARPAFVGRLTGRPSVEPENAIPF